MEVLFSASTKEVNAFTVQSNTRLLPLVTPCATGIDYLVRVVYTFSYARALTDLSAIRSYGVGTRYRGLSAGHRRLHYVEYFLSLRCVMLL